MFIEDIVLNPYDQLFEENIDNRILVLNQDIDETLIENCMLYILKWNREDKDIPKKKREKIKIYINSLGGDSFIAGQFCSLIESSETPIVGVAFGTVASAAYHIYIVCHERYAFSNSAFLQHEGDLVISNTSTKAKNTMEFFENMDERYKQNILKHSNMSEEYYDSIYTDEFWMFADKAKDFGLVDKIIGIDCSMSEII